jgi:hypothetical protein
MKRTLSILAGSALVACLCAGTSALADEKTAAKKKSGQPNQEEMMKAWQAYMAPGEQHSQLVKSAGSWTAKVKHFDPSKPQPEETEASSEVTAMHGGRFVSEKFSGKMMGQAFEGFGVTGYNNKTKEYQSFWADSMGTGMMMMTGKADKTGKVITQTGTTTDPMTGKPMKMKGVTTIQDDDHHMFEMWMVGPDGKMHKGLEIAYTRKK